MVISVGLGHDAQNEPCGEKGDNSGRPFHDSCPLGKPPRTGRGADSMAAQRGAAATKECSQSRGCTLFKTKHVRTSSRGVGARILRTRGVERSRGCHRRPSRLGEPAHVAGSPWISPCVEFARATVSISLWTARGFRIVCNMRCDLSRICLWLPRSRSEVPDNQIRVTPRVPALGRANVTATPRP